MNLFLNAIIIIFLPALSNLIFKYFLYLTKNSKDFEFISLLIESTKIDLKLNILTKS